VFLLQPSSQAGTVGATVPTNQIMVNVLDRTLPASGMTGRSDAIATRTALPVTLTFADINSTQRNITFNVGVPAGHTFIFGFENTGTGATHTYSAVQIDTIRTRINAFGMGAGGITQLQFTGLTVAAFNRMTTGTTARFHIYLIPTGIRTINFDTQGGNLLPSITVNALHPEIIGAPEHPDGEIPFAHWSTTPNGPAVTSAQIASGATLHAVWLYAPQNVRIASTTFVMWNLAQGATGYQIWWYRNGSPYLQLGTATATATQFNLNNQVTAINPNWTTGNQQVMVRAVRGAGAGIQLSEFSNPITYNEARVELPVVQNVRLVNGNTLVWDHVESTSHWIVYDFLNSAGTLIHSLWNNGTILCLEAYGWLNLNSFIIRARCQSNRYLSSHTPLLFLNSIDQLTLPAHVTPIITYDTSGGISLRIPVSQNALGYDVEVDMWGDWQPVEELRYQDVNGRRILREMHNQLIPEVERRGDFYYFAIGKHLLWNWGLSPQDIDVRVRVVGDYEDYASSGFGYVTFPLSIASPDIENFHVDEHGFVMWNNRNMHFAIINNTGLGYPVTVEVDGVGFFYFWDIFILEDIGIFTNNTYTITMTVPGDYWTMMTINTTFNFSMTQQLTTPVVSIAGNRISWNDVPNASGNYRIYVNGVYLDTTTLLQFDLSRLSLGLGNHSITVVAEGQNGFTDSNPSTPVFFNVVAIQLNPITEINNLGTVYFWLPPSGNPTLNLGYEVQIQGNPTASLIIADANQVTEQQLRTHFNLGPGLHTLQIRVLGNGTTYTHSNWVTREIEVFITLEAPTALAIVDGVLEWVEANGSATGFVIYIVDSENVTQTFTVGPVDTFTLPRLPIGVYTIHVVAVHTNQFINNSLPSASITHTVTATQLATPVIIGVTEGVLSWNAVTGAEEYHITVDGHSGSWLVSSGTQFNINNIINSLEPTGVGTFNFRVQAVVQSGHQFYVSSELSTPFEVVRTHTLATPTNINVTHTRTSTNSILNFTLNSVEHASYFRVYVDSVFVGETGTGGTSHNMTIALLAPGTRTITLVAMNAWSTYIHNSLQGTANFDVELTLDTPSGLAINAGVLTWDAVTHSSSYLVLWGTQEHSTTTRSVNLATIFGNDINMPGTNHTVRVVAVGDQTFTFNSTETSIAHNNARVQLPAPTITRNGNMLEWTWTDERILNFAVYRDGTRWGSVFSADEFALDLFVISSTFGFGTHDFQIRALGNVTHFIESELSNTIAVTINQATLDTPTVAQVGNRIEWNLVPNATGYRVSIVGESGHIDLGATTDGVDITTLISEFTLLFGTFTVQVQARGDNHFFLHSVLGTTTFTRNYTTLNAPTLTWSGNILEWSAVSNATGYRIYVNGAQRAQGNILSYDFGGFTPYDWGIGNITITVRTLGNGYDFRDSGLSTETFNVAAIQLGNPNVRIESDRIAWDAITSASYRVYVFCSLGTPGHIKVTTTGTYVLFSYLTSNHGLGLGNFVTDVVAVGNPSYYIESLGNQMIPFTRSTTLETPTGLTITGNTLTWGAVTHAVSYRLYVGGVAQAGTITGTSFDLGSLNLAAGDHEIRIRAIGNNDYISNSDQSGSTTFERRIQLDTPTNIVVSGDRIVWNAVTGGIAGYHIYVNGVHVITRTTAHVYIADLGLVINTYVIRVRAIGTFGYLDSGLSVDYASITNTQTQLDAPDNVIRTGNQLSWDEVTNAVSYRIYLNGNLFSSNVTALTYDITTLLAGLAPGSHTVTVRAVGDGVFFTNSAQSDDVGITITHQLEAPNLSINEGVLSWGAVSYATGYRIYIGSIRIAQITGTSFDLNTLDPREHGVGARTIEVYAFGPNSFYLDSSRSTMSFTIQPIQLGMPTGLGISGNNLSWNNVQYATGFTVYVGSTNVGSTAAGVTSFDLGSITLAAGDHTIRVMAIGNGTTIVDSVISEDYVIFEVRGTLANPTNVQRNGNQITWDAVTNGPVAEYAVSVNGILVTTVTGTSISIADLGLVGMGTFLVQVRAYSSSAFYHESGFGSYSLVLAQLAAPTGLNISGQTLTWTGVTNSTGYRIYVNGVVEIANAAGSGVDISDFWNTFAVGTHNITIVALGDGIVFFNSVPSASTQFTVTETLVAPTFNIDVNNILRWDAVSNSTGYRLMHGASVLHEGIIREFDLGSLHPSIFGVGPIELRLYTLGDGTHFLTSVHATVDFNISAITLSAPSGLDITGDMLTWDAVSYATGYRVYITGPNNFDSTFTRTSSQLYFDLGTLNLRPGTYTILVRALGASVYLVDSAQSTLIQHVVPLIQLNAPTNVREVGNEIHWDASLTGVQQFVVFVDGVAVITTANTFIAIADLALELGTFAITVVAEPMADYIISEQSLPLSITRTQNALVAPVVNLSGTTLSWATVVNASSYRIYVGGLSTIHTTTDLSFDVTLLGLSAGIHQISVRAISGYVLFGDSARSNDAAFTVTATLDSPGYTIDVNDVLRWNAVTGSTEYRLMYGVTVLHEGNIREFDLRTLHPGTFGVGPIELRLYAIGNGTYLITSLPVTINFTISAITLDAPTGLAINNGILTWNEVVGATGFTVYVNGTPHSAGLGREFDLGGLGLVPGSHNIQIRSLGNGDYLLNSVDVATTSFYVPRIQLSAPSGLAIDNDRIVWDAVTGTNITYELQVNGTQIFTTSLTYVYIDDLIAELTLGFAVHSIRIRVLGDVAVHIESGWSTAIDLVNSTTLSAPTGVTLGEDRILRWNWMGNVSHYRIYVNGTLKFNNVVGLQQSFVQIWNTLPLGTNTITVIAVGDGVVFLNSNPSAGVDFLVELQLATPTLSLNGNILSWGAVQYADGYRIYVGTMLVDEISELSFDLSTLDPRIFGVGNVTIRVIATASTAHLDSHPALQPFNIAPIVLDAPDDLAQEDGVLTWDTPEYATNGFAIYANGSRVGVVAGNTVNLNTLGLGRGTHQIQVRALGDNGNFANSSISQEYIMFTITGEDRNGFTVVHMIILFASLVAAFAIIMLIVIVLNRRKKRV